MTFFLERSFRNETANNTETWKAEQVSEAATENADSFFETAVFAEKMQPAIFLIQHSIANPLVGRKKINDYEH